MTKTSVAANKLRPFFKKSFEDALWLRTQPISVRILWDDAAMSDPFGEKWHTLETVVEGSTFRAARKAIERYGAFEFRVKSSGRDRRKTVAWEVKNLHGAYTAYYTEIPAENSASNSVSELPPENSKLPAENSAPIAEHSAGNTQIAAKNSAGIAENSAPNLNETLSLIQPCSSFRSKEDQIKEIKEDLTIHSSENRSGRFVGSSPLGGEAAYTSGASTDERTQFGATQQSENLGRSEPCRTSSESENEHRRQEAESTHQQKSSAPPHHVSTQSDTRSNEDDLQEGSAAPSAQTNSEPTQHVSSALPGAAKPHLFHKVMEEAIKAGLEKGINYPDEFWTYFLSVGRTNQLAPVRLGLEKMGANLDDYIDSFLGDYILHDATSGNPVYCPNTTMKLKVWTH